jgi:molecular chaperone GrpE
MSKESKETEKDEKAKEAEAAETSEKKEEVTEKEAQETAKQEESPEQIIARLQEENAALKDQYLRKAADFDNYRKRTVREKQEAYDYANEKLLTDLVTILDNFDRALEAAPKTEEGKTDAFTDGIRMINKQLTGLLESKYNLSCYGVKGEAFNHDIHEAIGKTEAPVAEPVLAEVYLKGYMLKDRVIRPAKVMVNMPDGSVKETQEDTK